MLSALLTETTQGVLAAILLQSDRQWYLSELAAYLGVRPSTLQRTLSRLAQSGILVATRNGNRVHFHVDPDCPILPELRGLLSKTRGIADILRQALAPLRQEIAVAFIHGSVAEGREVSGSDVDLIIIGQARPSAIALTLRKAQERIAREVNPTVYTAHEFADKLATGHHFLTAVMKKRKVFLVGGEHELEKITVGEA
jgi:predicted nucleotidyltransferase